MSTLFLDFPDLEFCPECVCGRAGASRKVGACCLAGGCFGCGWTFSVACYRREAKVVIARLKEMLPKGASGKDVRHVAALRLHPSLGIQCGSLLMGRSVPVRSKFPLADSQY